MRGTPYTYQNLTMSHSADSPYVEREDDGGVVERDQSALTVDKDSATKSHIVDPNAQANALTVSSGETYGEDWEDGKSYIFGRFSKITVTQQELEENAERYSERERYGSSFKDGVLNSAGDVAGEAKRLGSSVIKGIADEPRISDPYAEEVESMPGRARAYGKRAWKVASTPKRMRQARAAKAAALEKRAAKAYRKKQYRRSASLLARAKRKQMTPVRRAAHGLRGIAARLSLASRGCALPAIAIIAITAMLAICLFAIISGATSAMSSQNTGKLEGNAQVIAAYFLSKGVDQMHTAAILGALDFETGGRFDPSAHETASDAGGIGICQWPTNSAYSTSGVSLMQYAESVGRRWDDINLQLDFLWCQLTGEESSSPGISDYAHGSWGWCGGSQKRYDFQARTGLYDPPSWNGFLATTELPVAVEYFVWGYLRPADWAANVDARIYGDASGHTGAMQYYMLMSNKGYGGISGDSNVVARAYAEIGKPYIWGACGPSGFDCSGLVSYCIGGVYGSRLGTTETFMTWPRVSSPQPGDICTSSYHCGIYIGGGQMIHAPTTGDVVKVGPVQSDMIYVRYGG